MIDKKRRAMIGLDAALDYSDDRPFDVSTLKNLQPDDYGIRHRTDADQKELETLRRKSRENEQHIALLKLHIVVLERELEMRSMNPLPKPLPKQPLSKRLRAADPILPPPTENVNRILPPGPSFNSEM